MGTILSLASRSVLTTPHGIVCIDPLFLRQRQADLFRALFEATRRGKTLRHLLNGVVDDEKPVVILHSITDYTGRDHDHEHREAHEARAATNNHGLGPHS